MKQLTQKLKDGKMNILEVPVPVLNKGHILVQNMYSLISSGTEGSTVKAARKGYIGKAKERPAQVKQVVDTLRSQGPVQTYRAVMKKLDAHSPLGYSCVGKVIDVSPEIKSIEVGDTVACGGLSASHAEVVSIPLNLCVKIHPESDAKQATYNTLGAIAMQGVRQADLRLGETCAVIGLGLIGQLASILLRASGVRVIGVDVDPRMVEMVKNNCADLSIERGDSGIEEKILQFTDGVGCDAVIIAAASDSNDPINFAGAISRKKGTVVILGDVPTGFDREPYYYKKELQVKMSCSYGPGRYDPIYEEKGNDYPVAYVRWTENRNMKSFQELICSGKIDLSYLTTHTFKLENAKEAYDLLIEKSEPFIGILIEYDFNKKIERKKIQINKPYKGDSFSSVSIGFMGAGSYAQSHLLPNIPKSDMVNLKGVVTATGTSSRSVADRFGFAFCSGDENDILNDDNINTVFIATRHNTHARLVVSSLKARKHVFVEKPLCLTEPELDEIKNLYVAIKSGSGKNDSGFNSMLMVGYNRRFSPMVKMIRETFGDTTMAMQYRINAGHIPHDTWYQDPETGGGRIIGEVCHFVDLLMHINGSLPTSVFAKKMEDPHDTGDTITATLTFENGSIGNISYFANGDKNLPKERIEIYANGNTAIIDDFKSMVMYINGKKKKKNLPVQDKGQKEEVRRFVQAVQKGEENVIPFEEIYYASYATFKIITSIQSCRQELIGKNILSEETDK